VTADGPRVSVVVPAYNAGRTIGETVRSALAQSVRDLEIIVVDDGSSDDTICVVGAIDDPRISVVPQQNSGAAAARNTGIRAAEGTWVAFLDADDIWMPTKLERQLAYADAHPDVHALQTGATFVDDELRVLHVRRCQPSSDALWETLLFRNLPAFLSTLLVRRSKFEEMGYFDTGLEILEEWDMAIKASRFCNMQSIEDSLCLYRIHPGNRSRNLDIHVTPGLVVLERLFADPAIPEHVRSGKPLVYAHFYAMLAGGALKVGRYRDCARWALKAAKTDPRSVRYMAELPIRRITRLASRFSQGSKFGSPIPDPDLGPH
jgi:glycosyltransferase involved in cell wall biosynthesis